MASRKIEDLDLRIQPFVRNFLDEANKLTAPWTTFITDGFRTYAEQAELYASGRTKIGKILTNAPPGTSNHEKGLAVDIAFQKDGALSYAKEFYDKIVPVAKKLGFAWGGDWTGFSDKPHFEMLTFNQPSLPPKPVTIDLTGLETPLTRSGQESYGIIAEDTLRSKLLAKDEAIFNYKNNHDLYVARFNLLKEVKNSKNWWFIKYARIMELIG